MSEQKNKEKRIVKRILLGFGLFLVALKPVGYNNAIKQQRREVPP